MLNITTLSTYLRESDFRSVISRSRNIAIVHKEHVPKQPHTRLRFLIYITAFFCREGWRKGEGREKKHPWKRPTQTVDEKSIAHVE